MISVNIYHLSFYITGLAVTLTCLIYMFLIGRFDKPQSKLYTAMLAIVTLNIISLSLTDLAVLLVNSDSESRLLIQIGDYTYLLFHAMLCPMFLVYVCFVAGVIPRFSFRFRIIISIPFALMELLILLNPLIHQVYSYAPDGHFQREWGEYLIYLMATISLILALMILFRSWKAMNQRRRMAIFYFVIVVVSGVLIQLFFFDIRCELFAEAIALMGVMQAIELEDDMIDVGTGFRNRKGLELDMKQRLENKLPFEFLCVKINNAHLVQKVTGSTNHGILAEILTDYFKTVVPIYQIYQINPNTFLLMLTDLRNGNALETAARLHNRFEQPWLCRKTSIFLNSQILVGRVPEDIHDVRELFYMCDCEVPDEFKTRSILSGHNLDYLIERREMEEAITRGLRNHSFVVYYQPTYCMDGKTIHSAEALCRLKDEKYGLLMPDDFIPIAEQMGVIDEIDDYVLRDVCEYIAGGMPNAIGLESIHVNLSVVQCIQPAFASHICSLVDEYRINRSMITFEITESIGADDYEKLGRVVSKLKKAGFRFAMDDFGTGFSNMNAIFSIDFDMIKIDKSLLWGAEKSVLGKSILRNSVRMIKELKRKVLVEGVETEEQLQLLCELGIDYMQGFYFSKPVPKEEIYKK